MNAIETLEDLAKSLRWMRDDLNSRAHLWSDPEIPEARATGIDMAIRAIEGRLEILKPLANYDAPASTVTGPYPVDMVNLAHKVCGIEPEVKRG